jgi:hypothetical protein
VLLLTATSAQYRGILINGFFGTQICDPLNSTNIQGNLQLGLGSGAGTVAVINGQLAYFGGTGELTPI